MAEIAKVAFTPAKLGSLTLITRELLPARVTDGTL